MFSSRGTGWSLQTPKDNYFFRSSTTTTADKVAINTAKPAITAKISSGTNPALGLGWQLRRG
jgi:hypothetical protein